MVEGVLREVRVCWNCGGGGKNWVVELWVLLIRLAILIGETDSSLNSSGMTAYELTKKLVAGNCAKLVRCTEECRLNPELTWMLFSSTLSC